MNKFVIAVIFSSILLVSGGVVIFGSGENSASTKSTFYSVQDTDKPIAQTDNTFFDMGKIKVKETKTKDFLLKNTGTKPLQITEISSSCGCTAGKIIYKGKESGEFSMHSKSKEMFEIDPYTEALVRLIYRPFQMPVYGSVEREVYLSTNDPQNPKLVFKIAAYVQ